MQGLVKRNVSFLERNGTDACCAYQLYHDLRCYEVPVTYGVIQFARGRLQVFSCATVTDYRRCNDDTASHNSVGHV